MLLGIAMNFIGLNPIKALIYSAVANALIAPFVLVLIVRMSSSKKIMREHANGMVTKWLGWFTVVLMALFGIAVIVGFFL